MIAFGNKFLPEFAFRRFPALRGAERIAEEPVAASAVFGNGAKSAVCLFNQKDVKNLVAVTSGIVIAQKFGADYSRHIFTGKYEVSIRNTVFC